MGLFKNNPQGGVMDVIRCDEKSYLIWKWRPEGAEIERNGRENAIRWGSSLRVKEGSVAVFVYSGKEGLAQDYIVGPADIMVDTNNLPVIASLIGKLYNGGTPFQAEVYFVNLAETVQTKFGIPFFEVFDRDLEEFGVPIAVRGSIDFNIEDYKEFIRKHRLDNFSLQELQTQIKDTVAENVKSVVANAPEKYEIPVIQIERKISEIKEEAAERLREKLFIDYGVYLKDINISDLEINKESEAYQELKAVTKDLTALKRKAKAKADAKDISANQKIGVFERAANAFVDAKENAYARRKETQRQYAKEVEEERAGKLGAAGAKIISAINKKNGNDNRKPGEAVPPPVPNKTFHIVMYGKAAGPYDLETLKKMAEEGRLNPDSYVWTDGMDNWAMANTIQELKSLFVENGIPSLPPIPSTNMKNNE